MGAIPRRADIVFPRLRLAVFVDGCFWHGCPDHMSWPRANSQWWRDKTGATRRRDEDTTRRLKNAGWSVLRVWEHEHPDDAAARIAAQVDRMGGVRADSLNAQAGSDRVP